MGNWRTCPPPPHCVHLDPPLVICGTISSSSWASLYNKTIPWISSFFFKTKKKKKNRFPTCITKTPTDSSLLDFLLGPPSLFVLEDGRDRPQIKRKENGAKVLSWSFLCPLCTRRRKSVIIIGWALVFSPVCVPSLYFFFPKIFFFIS